jgi:hypothetical protein
MSNLDRAVAAAMKPDIHHHVLNLQQLYHHFMNSLDASERAGFLKAIYMVAGDLREVCLITPVEPERQIYKQLENE